MRTSHREETFVGSLGAGPWEASWAFGSPPGPR